MTVEVDSAVDAVYIRLADSPVVRTVELSDAVLVDLDAADSVIGIETLNSVVGLPLDELGERFHVPASVLGILSLVRPSASLLATANSSQVAAGRDLAAVAVG